MFKYILLLLVIASFNSEAHYSEVNRAVEYQATLSDETFISKEGNEQLFNLVMNVGIVNELNFINNCHTEKNVLDMLIEVGVCLNNTDYDCLTYALDVTNLNETTYFCDEFNASEVRNYCVSQKGTSLMRVECIELMGQCLYETNSMTGCKIEFERL